jgi:predicted ATPase/class 3 adenylate cyclase
VTAAGRGGLPSGLVTFVFTDVEGSTRLLRELGAEAYANVLADHRALVRHAVAATGGVEVDTQGDAFFLAFADPAAAVRCADAIRTALAEGPVRLRIGIHTGRPVVTAEGYVGEDVHLAARVAAAAHGGQVVLTDATQAFVAATAPTESLGEHRLKDFAAPLTIHQLGSASFPPLRSLGSTNLPKPLTALLGRDDEVAAVRSRLERSRIVTLTGPGGTGKTRLAIEAARSVAGSYPAGTWWVPCAPVREPALVLGLIADVIGARDDLRGAIGRRRMLLVIDNLEQVMAVAPDLAALCHACPELRLLVTSRERLGVVGEDEHPVPTLAHEDAVTLFCTRAGLAPTAEIATLCRRLDDLPLAVELAAARTRVLSPAAILDRLDGRLDLLSGSRDVDPRRETLRATIDWSHDLLDESDRAAFRGLAIFADGCDLAAAEEVLGPEVDVLGAVESLLAKSLLRLTDDRVVMLETIRTYAGERQRAAPDAADVEERFVAWAATLVEDADRELRGPRQVPALVRLDRELENIRAAVSLARRSGRVDALRRLVAGAAWWMSRGGRTPELLEWVDGALSMPGGTPELRGRLLQTAIFTSAERDRIEALGAEGLALARDLGDAGLEAGFVERLAFFRPPDEAMAMLAIVEETFGRIGRTNEANRAAINRGAMALEFGDVAFAEDALTNALARVERTGNRHGVGVTLGNRAIARLMLGRVGDAAKDLDRAVDELDAVGDLEGLTLLLLSAGLVAGSEGDPTLAAVLLAAAESGIERLGLVLDAAERRVRTDLRAMVAALPDDRRAVARERGRGLSATDALARWRSSRSIDG